MIIPSSPADLMKIKKVVEEMVNSKYREQGEKDYQKEASEELGKALDIKPAVIRKLAGIEFKNEYDKLCQDQEEFDEFRDAVLNASYVDSEELGEQMLLIDEPMPDLTGIEAS